MRILACVTKGLLSCFCCQQSAAEPTSHIDSVPDEIINKIFSFLLERDFVRASGTSNRFFRIANQAGNSEYWKKKYQLVFEYTIPLFHSGLKKFEFRDIEQWEVENPWKESFKQLCHGVHVRPGYSELYKGDGTGRKLTCFDSLEEAITFLESRKEEEALIFLHPGHYEREKVDHSYWRTTITIDRSLQIIGAAPQPNHIAEKVIIERSQATTILFLEAGAENAYLGYVTVKRSPDKFEGDPLEYEHSYAVEVSGECSPLIEHCVMHNLQASSGEAALCVCQKASPEVRHCTISDSEIGIYITEKAKGRFEICNIHHNQIGIFNHDVTNPTFIRCRIHGNPFGAWVWEGSSHFLENNIYADDSGILIEESDPIIENNEIGGQNIGVDIENGRGLIKLNNIHGYAQAGIQIRDGSSPTVLRNKIHDGQNGIYVRDEGKGLVEDNEIFRNAQAGVLISTKSNPTLRRNRIFDGNAVGVEITNGATATLEHNVISSNRLEGLCLAPDVTATLEKNDLFNNGK